jgi:serine/threonine-protein phosphatase PP1 catalytic subunit
MGNNVSTKNLKKERKTKSKSMPLPPRLELPVENEQSTNTAHSVNSILLTSKNSNTTTSLAQLNPDYPVNNDDTITSKNDPFNGKVENPQQHKLLATSDFWPPQGEQQQQQLQEDTLDTNQLTVGSMNQLTVNSVSSVYSSTTHIDDYINRLLEAGYSSKVSRQLCLKHSEVTAICRAAMDVFLSQPVQYINQFLSFIHSFFFDLSISVLVPFRTFFTCQGGR